MSERPAPLLDEPWHVPAQAYQKQKETAMFRLYCSLSMVLLLSQIALAERPIYDVVVYGGTSGGVAAAIQTRRMGKTVLLIEPGRHLGGLTSGGLGATDIGNKAAIGGISREFYGLVKKHYENPESWRQQRREDFRSRRKSGKGDTMWTFEPHVAERIYRDMIRQADVEVVLEQRLDRKNGVVKKAGRIASITMESGKVIHGRTFIDATYEGDLLAAAGVSYTVGREANATYDETINGVQTRNAVHHQFVKGVDPYVKKGDPKSGLLPGLHAGGPGVEGSGDRRVQAYNLRMCVTDAPTNRVAFEKPAGYKPLDYELLLRNFEAGEKRIPWSPTAMPNRKTDTNNNFGFSTDFIGESYDWAEASYAQREKSFQQHLHYQRGLMWTLANHPRVPEHVRREVSRWGNCKDEFPENRGWSHQLYVREARRLVSDYVMNQHNCQGQRTADDPVGLAAYTMDSHNVQRYVDASGQVRNEGDVQVGGFSPYPISYRSLVPKQSECENLLVPVCLSASHIAYGSIRMEPVFMVLGQSAATAACQSIDQKVAVQKIDYARLRQRLLADKQVLVWTGPVRKTVFLDPQKLPGIVVDDTQAETTGQWLTSRSASPFIGSRYIHDNNDGKGDKSVRFSIPLKQSGRYEVRLAYTPNPNRASNVPVTIHSADGEKTVRVDQKKVPPIDKTFISLGVYRFDAKAKIVVANTDTDGYTIADAVQLLPVKK